MVPSLLLILALLWPAAPPLPARLFVLGDSVAHGAGASTPERSWAALVARALDMPLTNNAIDSSTVAEQPMPSVTPGDLVIWLVGYNDMRAATPLASFRATVASGVAALKSHGARVLLVSGLRMTAAGYAVNPPHYNHGSDIQAKAYANAVRDLAAFVDLSGFVPSFASDLVHPDDAGHAQIAAAILAPLLTASWERDALHVTWVSPGWHCLKLDFQSLDCRNDGADLALRLGGVDLAGRAYVPAAGKMLRLIDEGGHVVAELKVPIHLTARANLPVVVNLAQPPPAPVWRVWLTTIY